VEGYDKNLTKVVSYNGLCSNMEVGRVFLNPAGSVAEGQVRAVLSWGEHPADLDLHCFSSKVSKRGKVAEEERNALRGFIY